MTLSLLLRTPTVGHLSNTSDIIIGDINITPSPSARNLGAIFDEHLTMEAHVNSVCRSSFFQLRVQNAAARMIAKAGKMGPYLTNSLQTSLATNRIPHSCY